MIGSIFNMIHNRTRLPQFCQQVQVHTVLLGLHMFGDFSYSIYCPSLNPTMNLTMKM